jgi:hypothetical protein
MTEAQFRRLALSMPGAAEGSHMGHPDFRVKGKIFATIFYDEEGRESGIVKLTPAQQAKVVKDTPGIFASVPGGWGRAGATSVHLKEARVGPVREAVRLACENVTTAVKR